MLILLLLFYCCVSGISHNTHCRLVSSFCSVVRMWFADYTLEMCVIGKLLAQQGIRKIHAICESKKEGKFFGLKCVCDDEILATHTLCGVVFHQHCAIGKFSLLLWEIRIFHRLWIAFRWFLPTHHKSWTTTVEFSSLHFPPPHHHIYTLVPYIIIINLM